MELIYCEKLTQQSHLDGVWRLLRDYDKAFIPPLSNRESTCQKDLHGHAVSAPEGPRSYFEQLQKQSFLLAVEQDEVVGFFSFRQGHLPPPLQQLHSEDTLPVYITTIIVDQRMRRRGIARSFYDLLMSLFPEQTMLISTRTWSTNNSHISLLEKMGFTGPLRIENDRGPGIDTVYYHFYRKGASRP